MRKTPAIWGLVSACLLAVAAPAFAVPGVADMLGIKPKFDDVAITTPTAEEMKDCKVEEVMSNGKTIGWALVDGRKQILRRYVMGKDAPRTNVWSFYKDGVEVFRQIDSNFDGKVDQYRWLGTAGLKWGVDQDQDGKIDSWYMISAEEVAQEVFAALTTNDFDRLKALYITPAEIQGLTLPAGAAAKMAQAVQAAQAKFQQAIAGRPNLAKASFVRVESAAPGCWVGESIGAGKDIIKYASRSVLYETADKKHDWLQIGEIVQVGLAWRLIDVAPEAGPDITTPNPLLNKLLAELAEVDQKIPGQTNLIPGQPNAALAALHEQRVALATKIMAEVKEPAERENWYKQILDGLMNATLAGSDKAGAMLKAYRDQLVEKMPGSNLAAYATYREMWSKYSPQLANPKEAQKVQEAWIELLTKFVKDYPTADETPDRLNELGMYCEFAGPKEKEEEAAKWYGALHTRFPNHHLAEWSKGAERRLKLTGNPLILAGTQLTDGKQFAINQLKDSVTIVYYWASNCTTCAGDFARLKQALAAQKGVELVCVNLDEKAAAATEFLGRNPVPATHLAQAAANDPGGLRGSLATYYGINVLPTVFLVGRDGRVINTKLQLADLEEALKKAVQP